VSVLPARLPAQVPAAWLARGGSLVLALGIAIWLGYAAGRGQSLAEVSRLYRDASTLQYTIATGSLAAHYTRAGGSSKPLLQTPDGIALVDYSDWDYAAGVVVDGRRYELVRLNPTDTVDYARNRIVGGLSSGDWVLSREIVLGAGQATITYSFLAKQAIHDVRLSIAHANWYYLTATPGADGFVATVARATRADIEQGLNTQPAYEVRVEVHPAGPRLPDLARIGTVTSFGLQSVLTNYVLVDPPVGDMVPVGWERVTWKPVEE
jgi:hypothetical protein